MNFVTRCAIASIFIAKQRFDARWINGCVEPLVAASWVAVIYIVFPDRDLLYLATGLIVYRATTDAFLEGWQTVEYSSRRIQNLGIEVFLPLFWSRIIFTTSYQILIGVIIITAVAISAGGIRENIFIIGLAPLIFSLILLSFYSLGFALSILLPFVGRFVKVFTRLNFFLVPIFWIPEQRVSKDTLINKILLIDMNFNPFYFSVELLRSVTIESYLPFVLNETFGYGVLITSLLLLFFAKRIYLFGIKK